MKILFVLPPMVTGGVERVTLRLVDGLQAHGHECAFALRRAYGEFLPEAEALCPVFEVAAGGLHQLYLSWPSSYKAGSPATSLRHLPMWVY